MNHEFDLPYVFEVIVWLAVLEVAFPKLQGSTVWFGRRKTASLKGGAHARFTKSCEVPSHSEKRWCCSAVCEEQIAWSVLKHGVCP